MCPGGQGDVSVHGNLLFMSVEQVRGRLDCGTQGVQKPISTERFRGVRIFDITNLNIFWALHDTRTPLRTASIRVCLTIGLGYLFALPLPRALGIEARWGAAGLTASAGIAGWVEFLMLRRALNRRIGRTGLPVSLSARLWGSAAVAAAAGLGLRLILPVQHPVILAIFLLGTYGVVYLALTAGLGVAEAGGLLRRLKR